MHVPFPVARQMTRRLVKPILGTRLSPVMQRRALELVLRASVLPKGTQVQRGDLGGVPAEQLVTTGSVPGRALLYLHGGAYLVGSPATHRAAAAHLAAAVGAVGHVLDYRLAPEHPYPAAVDDALAAYRALLDRGLEPGQVVVAGDSAGGGLSLALGLRLHSLGLPQPAALGLMSPWVDLGLSGLDESVVDPLLSRDWLELGASSYAGAARDVAEVSPLHAEPAALAALPALFVQAGTDEMLRRDIARFVDVARGAGAQVTYRELVGHWHVTQLFAGLAREADAAVAELGGWLRAALEDAGR
ncbi:alpha/beta hydrolase fold domain-containing protein [Nocardioides sp. zg-536]|uniref:Alpha/beta hydrolase fold domain-containing protein n=1 Tax=Nocardioides faecalis TaxID=2803858 RepID=A0A938Y5D0_9ACTN|nr:alpha/beta hydrolase [Nocardioides faecalis]MBM9459530.1 alpha/beta hydrolase fold domain-containing protein [Nocardioides faecalis]MBS4753690.1 alpha/beta hydrolase fold domain-containing protein [Nocardioides faecalis]QVI58064.1 alpha/beta hydrolase fold domain-containing protein [Nocardioides faecalis]